MKKALIVILLALFGCTDSEDNASTNLRKGDTFMARGEFEIAEYYYEKIPEESVLYKTVLRRRKEMEKKRPVVSAASAPESGAKEEAVVITKHTYTLQLGKMPIHTLTVRNGTSKRLNMLEVEFVYLNEAGQEVSRMQSMVSAVVEPGEEKMVGKVAPGMVQEKFTQVKYEIKRSMLF
jgi:hypothetical protein